MDKQIKIVIPESKYIGAPSTDLNEKLVFEADRTEFSNNERNIRVDLAELFNTERQASEKYRLYGKITPVFVNAYSGTTNYSPLLNSLYLTSSPYISNTTNYAGYPPYNEFAFIRNDVTRDRAEQDGTLTEVVGNKHIEIYPHNSGEYNWNTYLTYVSGNDDSKIMTYTTPTSSITYRVSEGLPIEVFYDEKQRICICECPVEHGLSESDYVMIRGKLLKIDSLGNEVYESEKKVFNLQLMEVQGTGVIPGLHTFRRVKDANNISESTSKYYIQKHKVVSAVPDFIIDKCGFENSIFEDQIKVDFENPDGTKEVYKEKERGEVLLFHYKKQLERLAMTNNMDVPINEVYVTIVNKNGMGLFNYPPKVGWSFNFHDTHADKHFDGTASLETGMTYTSVTISGETFNTGNVLHSGTTLHGALVEYNKYELKERVVSESFHRLSFNKNHFNHNQDNHGLYPNSSSENMFGYFYQPHYRIKLKEYSSYIEESTTNNIENFPRNAIYFVKDKVWRWRELYNHGFIDDNKIGVDFPFINGTHYVKFQITFYIRSEYHFIKKDKVITPFTNRKYRNEC